MNGGPLIGLSATTVFKMLSAPWVIFFDLATVLASRTPWRVVMVRVSRGAFSGDDQP
jgi:hypothetical protein